MKIAAVIVCAGKSKRFKKDKLLIEIKNKPLFYYTFKAFYKIKLISQIILVLDKEKFNLAKKIIFPFSKNRNIKIIEGGKKRKDSVYNGLISLDKDITHVLIHDGARPFISKKLILNIIKNLKKNQAVICGIKSRDTVKVVKNGFVKKTLNRDDIYFIQTPQGFKKDLILEAYNRFKEKEVFDDAQLLEFYKKEIKVIDGDILNVKITYPVDSIFIDAIKMYV